ncbi:glycosyltransferase family 9 protein [bacterium]|nr:glycosyltransferase family 9 protein [bacterium]
MNIKEKLLYFCSSICSWIINTRKARSTVKTILIIKLDEIGDMVTSLHVFKHLHHQYPEAKMHLVCKKMNFAFFKYVDYVDVSESISSTIAPDIIVDLRGDFNSLFYALKSKAFKRVDRGSIRMKNKFSGGQKNELDTNFEIIQDIVDTALPDFNNEIILSQEEQVKVSTYLTENEVEKFALLHLGARDAARRWPIERFAVIADYLIEEYGMTVVLAGGPEDKERNEACSALTKNKVLNIAGEYNLLDFAGFCSKASLFIGNESGPMHIASSMGCSLIGLFGPGVKDVFYPRGENVRIHHYFLDKNHTKQTIDNSTIFKISVEEVQHSVDELISN